MEAILFYILASAAIISAGLAITRVNVLIAALWLVGCCISIGGLVGLMGAPIVALAHILLSASAIMALMLFVIMLVDFDPSTPPVRTMRFGKMLAAFIAAYLAAVAVLVVLRPPFTAAPAAYAAFGGSAEIGRLFAGPFAVPFMLIPIALLVAMVGAVVMAKRVP